MFRNYHLKAVSFFRFKAACFITCMVLISLCISARGFSSETYYSLKLSSFSDLQDAEKEVKDLENAGHSAFLKKEEGPDKGKYLYNVYIEKYKTKDEAEKEARVLKELDLIKDYSVSKISDIPEAPVKEEDNEAPADTPEQPKHTVRQKIIPPETEKKDVPKKDNKNNVSLRVGSFKEESNAKESQEALQKSGRKTFYRKEKVYGKGDYFRLYITGYGTIKDSVNDAKKLKESGIISGWVIPHEMKAAKTEPEKEKREVFFLHVSSLEEKEHAREKVSELKKYGYKAFFVYESINNKMWYRVYIGEFKDEKEARKTGEELRARGIISYFKPLAIDRNKIKK